MNQITAQHAFGAVTVPPLPSMSGWLVACIRHVSAEDTLPPLVVPPQAAVAVAAEAAAVLPILRRRARPAQRDEWDWFLKVLVLGVRNPPTDGDFDAFVDTVSEALDGVPAHLLSDGRRKSLRTAFHFWPSARDIEEWIAPACRAERAMLAEVQRLASAPPPQPEEREEVTADAIAAVAGKMSAFRAEMAQQEENMRPTRTVSAARPLAPHSLRALYEQQVADGGPLADAARARLAHLDRQDSRA